ncbi:hypothetical protein P7C70_g7076, partial [Phenoliferia sp. Uapishka_3]
MLDHKDKATSERVQWEDSESQSSGLDAPGPRSSLKGKEKYLSPGKVTGKRRESGGVREEAEDGEEMESLDFPPAAQPPSSRSRKLMDVDSPPPPSKANKFATDHEGSEGEPATEEEDDAPPCFPSQTQSQTQPQSRPRSTPPPPPTPKKSVPAEKKETKEEKRAREAEQELEMAREARKVQLAKTKLAAEKKGQGGPAAKKKKKL